MRTEWWIDDQGRNNLAGSYSDPSNPLILPDHLIVEYLLTYSVARESFKRLVPNMLPEEQARLMALADRHPRVLKDYIVDDPTLADNAMAAMSALQHPRDPNKRRR